MTHEEANTDQLTPGSYGYAKRKKFQIPKMSISVGVQSTDKHYQGQSNALEKLSWDSRVTIRLEENEKINIE